MILIYLFLSGPLFFSHHSEFSRAPINRLSENPGVDLPSEAKPQNFRIRQCYFRNIIIQREKRKREVNLVGRTSDPRMKVIPQPTPNSRKLILSFTPREHPNFHHLCSQAPNSLPDLLNTLVSFLINFFLSNFLIKFDNSIDLL